MLKTWAEYGVSQDLLNEEMVYDYEHIWGYNKKGNPLTEWRKKHLGVSLQRNIDVKVDWVATATEDIEIKVERVKRTIHTTALYLWAKDRIAGPSSSRRLMNQASKAESLVRYLLREGDQKGAEAQFQRAQLLRKAANGDAPAPKKELGIIDRLRLEFAKVDIDGKLAPRPSYIAAGLKMGVHPGTVAVQYARWKREKST